LHALALQGHSGLVRASLAALATLTVVAFARLTPRLVATVRRGRLQTRRRAEAAILAARAGRPGPEGSLIVDDERRSVYCLAGRPPTIVITSAALTRSADDVAARRHGGDTVVDALVALTLGTSERAVAPAAALGAAGVGVADRAQRLLFPPNTTRAWCAQTLTLGLFAARADRGRRADHDSVDVLSVRDDHLTRGDPRREGTMARPDRPTR